MTMSCRSLEEGDEREWLVKIFPEFEARELEGARGAFVLMVSGISDAPTNQNHSCVRKYSVGTYPSQTCLRGCIYYPHDLHLARCDDSEL